MVDPKLLKQALSELVVLKNRVHDPSRFLGHLYIAALEEWADCLSVHPGKLNKIVNGCTVLSNCEARIMYMKIIERMNAQMNSVNVLSSSRARPETVVV